MYELNKWQYINSALDDIKYVLFMKQNLLICSINDNWMIAGAASMLLIYYNLQAWCMYHHNVMFFWLAELQPLFSFTTG